MYNTLGFYSHYRNGDLFESREFVRDIMEIYPAREYVYYHNNSERILLDIDNLTTISGEVPSNLGMRMPFVNDTANGNLFLNTWIGRNSSYVLPGFACTLEQLYRMYNDILFQIDGSKLTRDILDYLTDIDYSKYDTGKIDEYMSRNSGRKMVLISNGDVYSKQAKNFDMSFLIKKLADTFADVIFFVTSPVTIPCSNVIDANEFTDTSMSSNLNELSYVSTFCDMIIGRNSGPQVFSWTKSNCFSDKVNITFSYNENCKHFVHSNSITMERLWSNATCLKKTFGFVYEIINRSK